jgi:hypothetical protein
MKTVEKEKLIEQFRQDNNLVRTQMNGKWGYIDAFTGTEIIPFKYDNAYNFSKGRACVSFAGKYGYIDENDVETIPFQYEDAQNFYNDFATVKLNGKWGFIDKTGAVAIPLIYDKVECFEYTGTNVILDGQEGTVDSTGIFIPKQPDDDNIPKYESKKIYTKR